MKVCTEAGLDLRHLQRLERGLVNASIRTLAKLAIVLEVPADSLLSESSSAITKKRGAK